MSVLMPLMRHLALKMPSPCTIEGPLYVAGAPVCNGFARLDDGTDENGHLLIMHGTVIGANGKPLPGAIVEVWHCDTQGFYSHFDTTGKQADFNMRRTIIADDKGCYKFQSILPSGYGVPVGQPDSAVAIGAWTSRTAPDPHPLFCQCRRPSQADHPDQHRRRSIGQ